MFIFQRAELIGDRRVHIDVNGFDFSDHCAHGAVLEDVERIEVLDEFRWVVVQIFDDDRQGLQGFQPFGTLAVIGDVQDQMIVGFGFVVEREMTRGENACLRIDFEQSRVMRRDQGIREKTVRGVRCVEVMGVELNQSNIGRIVLFDGNRTGKGFEYGWTVVDIGEDDGQLFLTAQRRAIS